MILRAWLRVRDRMRFRSLKEAWELEMSNDVIQDVEAEGAELIQDILDIEEDKKVAVFAPSLALFTSIRVVPASRSRLLIIAASISCATTFSLPRHNHTLPSQQVQHVILFRCEKRNGELADFDGEAALRMETLDLELEEIMGDDDDGTLMMQVGLGRAVRCSGLLGLGARRRASRRNGGGRMGGEGKGAGRLMCGADLSRNLCRNPRALAGSHFVARAF